MYIDRLIRAVGQPRDPAELRRHKASYRPLTGSPAQLVSGMGRQRVVREISCAHADWAEFSQAAPRTNEIADPYAESDGQFIYSFYHYLWSDQELE